MSHPNCTVKLVEVCKVAPLQPPPAGSSDSTTRPPPPDSLPLTIFDLTWLRFPPVQRLFFYKIPSSNFINNPSFFDSILVPNLKTSLSLTLQHFLPLAGNVIWPPHSPKPLLTYVHGDTVSLTIANSDDHNYFDHLISKNNDFYIKAKDYHPLVPDLTASDEKAAAMAFQVTLFPDRGFCIGTSMHHAILDGKTSTMFVKSWAHICKDDHHQLCFNNVVVSLPDQLKPFFDRRVIQAPEGLEPICLNQLLNLERPNNRSLKVASKFASSALPDTSSSVRGTFELTRANIQTLKDFITKQQQYDHQLVRSLSTFVVTCAYTWVCKAKVAQAHVVFVFSIDCRSRLNPPISTNYVGNCVALSLAFTDQTEGLLGEEGLVIAVNAINKAVKIVNSASVWDGAKDLIPIMYSSGGSGPVLLTTAGSARFEIYGTDFGWGKPKKVEIVSIERTGAMSVSESEDGDGGVEVGLVMEKNEMQAFASVFAQGLAKL